MPERRACTLTTGATGALVFVGATRANQNFTRDKAKIIKAVNAFTPTIVGADLACEPHFRMQRVLLNLTDNLATLRDQRRSIVYFGARLAIRHERHIPS